MTAPVHRRRAFALLAVACFVTIALGVAVASTVTAAHLETLTHTGVSGSAALAGGLQWAFWVTGVTALVAVAATFLLVRSDELEQTVEAATAPATA